MYNVYAIIKHKFFLFRINPVLGCYEPPKPNPFECMSVEQQEHEVMQLVSKMDKLTRYL